jgi:o-succinylbenzoate---CoA ligase
MRATDQQTWLAQRAASMPERFAMRAGGMDVTFGELQHQADEAAARLKGQGVAVGSIVPLEARPSPEFAAVLHAAWSLGAAVEPYVPGAHPPPAQTPDELTAPRHIGSPGTLTRLYTSGTSGAPRAVDLTRENFLYSAIGTAFGLGVAPMDRWLCCLPLHHVAGFSILTRSALYGTGVVMHDGFDVDKVAASFAEDGVTLVSLVATQLIRLLEADVDLRAPGAIIVGGGPVPFEAIEEAMGRGATVIQVYGMTETSSQVTLLETADAERKAGSAGRALLGAEVITKDGEILVRGPVVAPASIADDGWLHTGDLGTIDSEGYLWVDGRKDDLIVTGGENVMPERVEGVIKEHPDVADAAVVGRPDPEWQQAVTAIVVMRPGAPEDAEALRTHCAGQLAGYEVPKSFVFVPDLPRTASGKLMRSVLR